MLELVFSLLPAMFYLWGMRYLYKMVMLVQGKYCPDCKVIHDTEKRLDKEQNKSRRHASDS